MLCHDFMPRPYNILGLEHELESLKIPSGFLKKELPIMNL